MTNRSIQSSPLGRTPPLGAWPRRAVALVALLTLTAGVAAAAGLGANGGVRLLLHVEPYDVPVTGIQTDPCSLLVPLSSPAELVTDYPAAADTVIVWAYLYHPLGMSVSGIGYGIEYEGVDFLTSGSCADVIGQDPEIMGTWPESGSEMALVWFADEHPDGLLYPVSWFVLATQDFDGYFRVTAGQSPFAGSVGDTSTIPYTNPIWAYGQIGFGETAGTLPIPAPEEVPGAWGAIGFELR